MYGNAMAALNLIGITVDSHHTIFACIRAGTYASIIHVKSTHVHAQTRLGNTKGKEVGLTQDSKCVAWVRQY